MSRVPAIRARIRPRPEPPFDRLHDPVLEDVARGGPLARDRYPTPWTDTAALRRLAESKRAPLERALGDALAALHRRLDAPPESLASLDRLARGEAVCTIAGQQPSPLGGPIYTLHKTAFAVGLAAAVEARTGVPCVPVFWMHGEDSDFAEIRSATIGTKALDLLQLSLPDDAHHSGGLVGSVPIEPLADLHETAIRHWADLPAVVDAAELLRGATRQALDLGEAFAALMLSLFGARGLVVVDPRLPAFRNAGRPLIERYLGDAERLAAAARAAGEQLERRIGRRPLTDAALESFVFAVRDGTRQKISVAEARALPSGHALSPNVALRPVLQDAVLPTVAMACGSSELAYLAQLREVYEGLSVQPASPVPRLSATWLPPAALALLERAHVDPWTLVACSDQVLRDVAAAGVPAGARDALAHARARALADLDDFAERARAVDASLPQMVASARAKVDYQYGRLEDGLLGKVRHRLEREHPEWPRLRYYLLPSDRLQERTVASLEVVAYRGLEVASELCALAESFAERLAESGYEHLVLEL